MILSKLFKSFKFQVAAKFAYIESPVFSTHSKQHRIYLSQLQILFPFIIYMFFPQEKHSLTFLATW